MKKLSIKLRLKALTFFLCVFSISQAQVEIFYENCGNPTISPLALSKNQWSNTSVTYTGFPLSGNQLVEVRNNQTSNYSDGNPLASEGGNVYLNGGSSYFTIQNINTNSYNNLRLSFGVFGKTANAIRSLIIEYSTNNGLNYSTLITLTSYSNIEKQWQYISNITGLPQSSNLYLRFRIATDLKIRLDDILITGTVGTDPAPTINVTSNLTRFETSPSVNLITKKIYVEGVNLTGDITLTLPENSTFYLSKNIIAKADGQSEISITYNPTAVGYNEDTLLINTSDLLHPVAVKLYGKCNYLKPGDITANNITENSVNLNWEAVTSANQYLLNITKTIDTGIAENIIFEENFSKIIESDILLIGDRIDELYYINTYMNSTGWLGQYLYNGSDDDLGEIPGVLRIGKKEGGKGYLNTPTIDLSGENVYLKFKVRTFTKSNSKEETSIIVSHATDGIEFIAIDTLENLFPEFQQYTIKINNGTANSKIRFEGIISETDITLNNRFVLEDLQLVRGGIQKDMLFTNLLVNNNSYTVTGLNANETYDISVRAYEPEVVFVSPESNILNVTTLEQNNNGIQDIKNSQIYVSNNTVYIKLTNESKIKVYDILGKEILVQNGYSGVNTIQGLNPDQIYILKIDKDSFKIKL